MLSQQIIDKVKGIELHVKRLLNSAVVGDFTTAQKGSGFEFNQLRDYQEGDDVRFIDWKSSAKMNKIIVRQYLEERNRTIWLAVDTSKSLWYGSTNFLKYDIVAQAAAALALVAEYGRDSVGLIMFGSTASVVLPPKRGRSHSRKLFEKLFTAQPQDGATSFEALMDQLDFCAKKKGIIIILSDFIGLEESGIRKLKSLAHQHECIAIRVRDEREVSLPLGILLDLQDPETDELLTVSTSDTNEIITSIGKQEDMLLRQCEVSVLTLFVEKNFIEELVLFFRRQMMY